MSKIDFKAALEACPWAIAAKDGYKNAAAAGIDKDDLPAGQTEDGKGFVVAGQNVLCVADVSDCAERSDYLYRELEKMRYAYMNM